MGMPFIKFRLFFHKDSFIINILFPPLRDTLYAGRVKLFAEAWALNARHVSFRRRGPQNDVLGAHPRGSQRD